ANDENDLRSTVRDIIAARFHGQSVLEIEWHDRDGNLNIKDIPNLGRVLCPKSTMWVHPVCYAWDVSGRLGLRVALNDTAPATKSAIATKLGKRQLVDDTPLWNTVVAQPRPSMLMDFPRDKFLIGIHKAKTGSPLAASCLRPLAWWWVASNFCGDWLLNYAQLFGIPFRKATYKPGIGLSTQIEIKQMLQAMGSAGYVLLPEGADLQFESPVGAAGESPQAFLFNFANDQKRRVILHQTMSGGSHSGGSRGMGKAFGAVEKDTKRDCIDEGAEYAQSVINLQLVPSILNLNYGESGDLEAPTVSLVDDEDGNLQDAQALQIVAQLVDIGENHVRKMFKIPKPSAEEKIVGQETGTSSVQFAQQRQAVQQQRLGMAMQKIQIDQATAEPDNSGDDGDGMEAKRELEASAGTVLSETMRPLMERLEAISRIEDGDARVAALKKFLKDEPGIVAALKKDPSLMRSVKSGAMERFDAGLGEERQS
ncbi:MAG: DUF935 family protein, partial [Cyanobacteria bacterium REEB65]|nr:DUF935 family protein [Cyanobacteria bacterium REEB65]